jgi:hypothetical protein
MEVRFADQGKTDQRDRQQPDIFYRHILRNKVFLTISLFRIGYLRTQ